MSVAATVGVNLTTTTGIWSNNPTIFTYQWKWADGGPIAGATSPTYTPVVGDIGHPIVVSLVASNGPGSLSLPATSLPTLPVIGTGPPPPSGLQIDLDVGVEDIPLGA